MQIIGVLGGSGLYEIEGIRDLAPVDVHTPFGEPSDRYWVGMLGDQRLVFLPRHGRGHRLLPSELNYRANIHGFLQLGAKHLISISAVGSMRRELRPGDVVVVDQFIDWTRGRQSSFFGGGVAAHVPLADPVCTSLAEQVFEAARLADARVHRGGTYICINGPQFSTRAESLLYRSWGVDVIGMTNMPEAKLAREAGICYATAAMVTDYDCWHEDEEDVSVESVVEVLRKNAELAQRIVVRTAQGLSAACRSEPCPHQQGARQAVITAADAMEPQARRRLRWILGEASVEQTRPHEEKP